jgi:hypothetical protein
MYSVQFGPDQMVALKAIKAFVWSQAAQICRENPMASSSELERKFSAKFHELMTEYYDERPSLAE